MLYVPCSISTKTGTAFNCGIYSTNALRDSGDGMDGDIDNLALTLHADYNFRYLYAINSHYSGTSTRRVIAGDIHNLTIREMGGYEPEGYFTSTNYLSSPIVNGSALVHLENTTIPPNTGITIEFSDDNATWILNDWQPLFGGFESIDLRELNYSTGYYTRHNLSTTDLAVTPIVYQSRLITTIGNSTGGGGVPVVGGGLNSATILMLILLFILAILIYWGIKRK